MGKYVFGGLRPFAVVADIFVREVVDLTIFADPIPRFEVDYDYLFSFWPGEGGGGACCSCCSCCSFSFSFFVG